MKQKIIDQIRDNIKWLEDNAESDNIMAITQIENKLQIQAGTLAGEVIKAYAVMNELEDAYKFKMAEFISTSDKSEAKARAAGEATFQKEKKDWTAAKNTYKRFDVILERIDKICDSQRQRISVVKQADLKNIR
jgi:hypothetical protein